MDFWSLTPSSSDILRSRRRMIPERPTTDGKPNDVSEKASYDETGRMRISSFRMQFRMWATQVAIP